MEGHFFHRFKWDILQRHDNTDCIALTDRYRFLLASIEAFSQSKLDLTH